MAQKMIIQEGLKTKNKMKKIKKQPDQLSEM